MNSLLDGWVDISWGREMMTRRRLMAKRIEVSKDIEQDKAPPKDSWQGWTLNHYRNPRERWTAYDKKVRGKPLTEKIKD